MSEKFVKVLKEIGKIPVITNVVISNLQKNKNATGATIQMKGTWSFKNYSNTENNTVNDFYILNTGTNAIHSLPCTVQDKRIILSATSPCFTKCAHLFQDDDCCFVNVVSDGGQTISINVKDEEAHGKVYNDPELSSFAWSPDATTLVYVAEKFRPKSSSFFSKKPDAKGKGEKNVYIDDWGEQMEGQHRSVVVLLNTVSEEIKVLDVPHELCGGQVVWTPEGNLVGVAFESDPFRLGLIYCRNRASVLFHLNLDGTFSEVSERGAHVHSPRFSPDGTKLAFLRSPAGGPHVRSAQLCIMQWKETKPVSVCVDYVVTELKINDGRSFYGLCGVSELPLACWSNNSRDIVVSALNNFSYGTYVINTETKKIVQIPLDGSLFVRDVKDDHVLASLSTLTEPTRLVLMPLGSVFSENFLNEVTFLNSPGQVDGIPKDWHENWTFKTPNPHPQSERVSDAPIPSIYFGPTKSTAGSRKRPLIVWIHGGPHSMIKDEFVPAASFFVRLGYSILFPNYRGSLGQGRHALESLPGNVGTTDVDDVFQATLQCLQRYKCVLDESRVALFGGSHGGFLAAHLSAQHPEFYKVVSVRNPVIDISVNSITSDIPDCVYHLLTMPPNERIEKEKVDKQRGGKRRDPPPIRSFVESGLEYQIGQSPTGDMVSQMHEMSPLNLVDKVTAPTLLLLGTNDRRVPWLQGLFYHKALLARKIKTKTFVYEDNHALSKIGVNADCFIQTALWFEEHLRTL